VALAIPRWSDVFPSLEPYQDPKEVDPFDFEEVGDPRFGIVQVTDSLAMMLPIPKHP
jgi:hypothetical protein